MNDNAVIAIAPMSVIVSLERKLAGVSRMMLYNHSRAVHSSKYFLIEYATYPAQIDRTSIEYTNGIFSIISSTVAIMGTSGLFNNAEWACRYIFWRKSR